MKRMTFTEAVLILLSVAALVVLLRMTDPEPALPKCPNHATTTRCEARPTDGGKNG